MKVSQNMGKETFTPSLLLLAMSAFLTAISFPFELAKRRLTRSEQKRKRKWIDSKKIYVNDIGGKKWACISYVVRPFYDDLAQKNWHQNRRESLVVNQVFNELGYNTVVCDWAVDFDQISINQKFDIVFGLEPNFEKIIKRNPQALKIYYATGAYYAHQNREIKSRTDEFNKKFGTSAPYRRLAHAHNSCEIADAIIQIGGEEIKKTYPVAMREKISTVRQSTTPVVEIMPIARDRAVFVHIASTGNLLRGVQYLLDYFIKHQELTLHWFGDVEDEVAAAYKDKITPNIHIHGFVNTTSEDFVRVVSTAVWQISLSGSEGCPGSVLLGMKYGLIPILSHYLKLDNFEDAYYLTSYSIDDIDNAVKWGGGKSDEEVVEMQNRSVAYAHGNYNLATFYNDLKSTLRKIIESKKK